MPKVDVLPNNNINVLLFYNNPSAIITSFLLQHE